MRCLHCDGWGCSRCLRVHGEQSLDVEELREIRLRERVRELEARVATLAAPVCCPGCGDEIERSVPHA